MSNKIYFNSLNNSKFVTFMRDVITLYNSVSLPALAPFVTALSDATVDLNAAYRQERGSQLTKRLQELDERRDNAILGIKGIVKSHFYHVNPSMRRAADLLLRSMNKYGKRINKMGMQEESVTIKALLDEWTTDALLADAINLLHLQDWQQELTAANTAFQTVFMDRILEKAAKQIPSFTKQRRPVITLYRKLKRQTLAHAEIDPTTYSVIVSQLNELIKKYRV